MKRMNKKETSRKQSELQGKRRLLKHKISPNKLGNVQRIAIILIFLGFGIGFINLFLFSPVLSEFGFILRPSQTPTSPSPTSTFLALTPDLSYPSPIAATSTATPYRLIFDGFINCRAEPTTSSPSLVVIRGEPFTILARDQSGSWLLVTIKEFSRPCWINRNVPGLIIPDFSRIPVFSDRITPSPVLPSNTPYPTYTPLPTYTSIPTLVPASTEEKPSMAQWIFIYIPGCLASIGTIILGFLTLFSENFFSWRRSRLDALRVQADNTIGRYTLEQTKINSEIQNAEKRLTLDENRLNAEIESEKAKLELEKIKLQFEKEKYQDELERKNKDQKFNPE